MTVDLEQQSRNHVLDSMNGHYKAGAAGDLSPEAFLTETARHASEDGSESAQCGSMPYQGSYRSVGKPHPASFPFDSMTLTLKPPLGVASGSLPLSIEIEGEDMAEALQYGPTAGLPKLLSQLIDLQKQVHKREEDGSWCVITGAGCQNLMGSAFSCLLDIGDPVLVETPTYAGVFPPLRSLHAEVIEVGVDDGGLSPIELDNVMSSWPSDRKRPKVIYVNPIGCNPSGCSHSVKRRMDVLKLCKKHGLLIMEDDPYYYLAESRIPSYFELETQVFPHGGRVIRFDSFSKLLSAGMRLGFASGPKVILDAIATTNSGTILQASSLSQAVASGLLTHWGIAGFLNHAQHVADLYAVRRHKFEAIARKHLTGLADWVSPLAGMFLWVDLSPSGIQDSRDFALKAVNEQKVLTVPGSAFFPNKRINSYIRLSFSIIDLEEEAELGLKRLADAIRAEQARLGIQR